VAFLNGIRQLLGNGLCAIAGTAACLQEIISFNKTLLNVMLMRVISSDIAPSHFGNKMTKADAVKSNVANSNRFIFACFMFVMCGVLLLPGKAGAVIINNTVSVNSNAGVLKASTDVVSNFRTASTIELLQYSPVPVTGSTSVTVPVTSYSTTGMAAGPFVSSGNPQTITGTSISMPGTVNLLPASTLKAGESVFIRLTDADQNTSALTTQNILVSITSPSTGDAALLRLSETGPNTGVFVGYIQSSHTSATLNDDVISVGVNEQLLVNYADATDPTDVSTANAMVDPYGLVFSTTDGSLLDGATVTLVDVNTGLPATVYGDDGVSTFPSSVTTGGTETDSGGNTYNFPTGSYRFPYVMPGNYRLDIIPPAAYSGPSSVPTATIQALPGSPFSIVNGSRNENFVINPGPAIHIDIPLDSSAAGLFITKRAVKNSVAVGEFLQYQLDISNTASVGLTNVNIVDVLPVGFRFKAGSAKLNGSSVANPVISADGRTLTFPIASLPVSATDNLRYVVAVTSGAKAGAAINRASGTADGGVASNIAKASVKVLEEMTPSRSYLTGRVIVGGCDASTGKLGSVGIQLQSKPVNDYIDYKAKLSVDKVPVKGLSVVVTLPGTLEYVTGSALRDEVHLIDPVVKGNQLIFKLGKTDVNYSSVISFRTRPRLRAFGEYYIRAYAEFDDPGGEEKGEKVLQRTPIVINKIKDFSRVLRPRFDTLSAKLKPADLRELDNFNQSLLGQDIERIHIIGYTDKRPIRKRSRSIYANNEQLSYARAKSVADYMQKALHLKGDQIKITGMGANKQLYYSERLSKNALTASQQLYFNRRVEVLVKLKGQGKKSSFIISRGDSGIKHIDTVGKKGKMKEPDLADDYPGMKNVRLYLEDGRYVDTDENGYYHFEGLKQGTHVVQVDLDSIPDNMEVYSCERNNRFAGTPYSQFVDLQGGSLWRSDFYIRNKPVASLRGDVGLELSSQLVSGELHYQVKLTGKGLVINSRRLIVDLPYGTQYIQGSARFSGHSLPDPELKEGQLIFNLGNNSKKVWQSILSFKASQIAMSEGEFSTLAALDYQTADGKSRQSSAVVNTLQRQAESKRELIYQANYKGIDTGLSNKDQQRFDGAIDFLRGKAIRRIEVKVETKNQKIPEKYQSKYPDQKALSQARADLIGSYIANSLNLYGEQIKRIAIGSGPNEEKKDDNKYGQPSQQVEIYAALANEQAPKHVIIKESDSGMVNNTVIGVIPKHIVIQKNKHANVEKGEDGIRGIVDQQRISQRIMPVSIYLDSRLKLVFKVDNIEINQNRLAIKMPDKVSGKTFYSFIGVDLGAAGSHTLSVSGIGPFGNTRFSQALHIIRTGEVRSMRVVDTSGNVADGKTPVKVKVELLDKSGEPIHAETDLKLDSGDLKPYEDTDVLPDLRRKKDLVKVDRDGFIKFAPVTSSGLHHVSLSYNDHKVDVQVYVKPDYREWIMVGLAEGTMGYNDLSGNMQNLGANDIKDNFYKDGRLAFYAKGKIKGKYLLTVSYDSAKQKPDEANGLFGTIDPNKYYTLYGDATTVQYDAPSTEKLYLKIESDNFYAMFGDYNTGLTVTELTRYSRNLTGLKAEYQDKDMSFTGFASQTGQAFVKDEIRGDGTSGLYHLSHNNIVLNSETITIETRDRFRSEVTLKSHQLTRYTDYTFDPIDGTVYFKEPVYSRDENFNPIYIVVNYEVMSGGSNAITAGGRVVMKPAAAAGVEVGSTLIHEGTPGAEGDLAGFDAKYSLDKETQVKAEVAISNRNESGNSHMGSAMLAELTTNKEKLDGKLYLRRQESGFGLGQQVGSEAGTQKLGADGSYHLSDNTSVNAEIFRQENTETNATRDVANSNVEYKQENYRISGGARYAKDVDGTGTGHESTLLTGAAERKFMDNRLKAHTNVELPVAENQNADYPKRLIAGVDYQLTAGSSLFASQELTRGGKQDSSTTRAGLKATPWKDASIYTSVEGQQSEAGDRVFSNMGLTQGIQVDRFLRLDFGIERVATLRHPGDTPFNVNVPPASGTYSDDFTAMTAGATYKKKDWSLTSRAERREGKQEDKMGLLAGFYHQQSAGLGLSTTLQYFDTDRINGTNDSQTKLEFSLAHRPVHSRWIVLNRARYINEFARTTTGSTRTTKLINNINANYLIDRKNQLSLLHGIKYVVDTFDGDRYSGFTNLLGAEYRHDITHRWDVGAQVSSLISNVGNSRQYSWGVSTGYSLMKNLWVSVGVNMEGFTDEDFSAANYTATGVYAKFRFALDQLTTRNALAWWEKH
jgi:uncharacterized repeat protein (TIGR01451 family)